jgi:hypothetical protein
VCDNDKNRPTNNLITFFIQQLESDGLTLTVSTMTKKSTLVGWIVKSAPLWTTEGTNAGMIRKGLNSELIITQLAN